RIACREDRRTTAFHIARSPSPDIPAFYGAGERGVNPAFIKGRDHVNVSAEHERSWFPHCHQVAPPARHTDHLRPDALGFEEIPDVFDGPGGVARRILAFERNKVRADLLGLNHGNSPFSSGLFL